MTLNNATAERPQTGSSGPPQTAQECRARMAQLDGEYDAATAEIIRLDEDLRVFDADFASDDMQVERLEARRAQAVQRRDRVRRRLVYLGDELLPALEKADKLAQAEAHRTEAQRLEWQARSARKSLRDALVQALRAVTVLDGLQARHREHENQFSAIHAKLNREEEPNIYRHVELPLSASTRDHRAGLKLLWDVLAADDPRRRDPERFADALDRALMPYAEPPVEEEE